MNHPIMGFEHIHRHSDFSLQDGMGKVAEYAQRSKEINQRFLCITDHGVMGAIPQQILEGDKHKLTPIFGCEMYINPMQIKAECRDESAAFRKSLGDPIIQKKFDKSNHLLGIAYTNEGYKNLVRLTSWAWMYGFYKKPRINHEVLKQYKQGIIFTSTCGNSEIANAYLKNEDDQEGFAKLEEYIEMLGKDHFYLELMMLDWKPQIKYNGFLLRAHDKYGLPLVISQDCHYCKKEHSVFQRLMLMMQNGKTIAEIEALKSSGDGEDLFELQDENLWMKSEDELNEKWESNFQDIIDYDLFKQAKTNSVKICEMARNVEIDRTLKLPVMDDENTILKEAIMKGFFDRRLPRTKGYLDRIKEEYGLICEKGFSSYFIIKQQLDAAARAICPIIYPGFNPEDAIGPGRGCLSPDTPVRLAAGNTINLCDTKIGDLVFTIDGSIRAVEKIMSYPLKNEKVRRIKTYYGDNRGVTLTLDHEVLVEKGLRREGLDMLSPSTQKSVKKHQEPVEKLEWTKSDKIEVGDWCFIPTPQVTIEEGFQVDLSRFSTGTYRNGKKLLFDDNFVRHEYTSRKNGRSMRVHERFWKLNENWATVLGCFAGDGWTRSNDAILVGFCDCKSAGVHLDFVQEVFEEFGVDGSSYDNQDGKDIRQVIFDSPYMRDLFDILHPQYQHTPDTKHVPSCIISAPLELVQAYLVGYFWADGHEAESKVKWDTVSYTLAEQIRFLLLRLGIPSSLAYTQRQDKREEYSNTKMIYTITCPLDKRIGCSRNSKAMYTWRKAETGILLMVRSIDEFDGPDTVYDLQVEGNHNYLTSSFLVHNSVCGSLVAYCLGLHDVEPKEHDLLFSRFLSPARGGKQMKLRFTIDPSCSEVPYEKQEVEVVSPREESGQISSHDVL